MLLKLVFILFISLPALRSRGDHYPCRHNKDCTSCMNDAEKCGWCADMKPMKHRCDLAIDLQSTCTNIYDPEISVETKTENLGKFIKIQPNNLTINLRRGQTVKTAITATIFMELPVQIVFAFDFSSSMRDEWSTMITLSDQIVQTITTQAESQVGYVAFVDKTTFPISQAESNPNPQFAPTFYYKIISPLTNDASLLKKRMESQRISTNVDSKEASFEALLQTVVCDDIGWSNDSTVLKVVVILTDAGTKIAGDGLMVTIYESHDGKCHVDNDGEYKNGLLIDYPSPALVADALKKRGISTIIAAADEFIRSEYETLTSSWKGVSVTVTTLKEGGGNILELIKKARTDLSSKLQIYTDQQVPSIKKISVECPSSSLLIEENGCSSLKVGDKVTFNVEFSFDESTVDQNFQFQISTFGFINVSLKQPNECFCKDINLNLLTECNMHGFDSCGLCSCIEGWSGEKCDCQMSEKESLKMCTASDNQLVCSGKGECSCGKCHCKNDTNHKPLGGKFCECETSFCDPLNDGQCGGENYGVCECNKCKCNPLYMGLRCEERNCENKEWENDCINPKTNKICSESGKCQCGTCSCNNEYLGKFCEQKTTPVICADLKDIVSCFAFQHKADGGDCKPTNDVITYVTDIETFQCSILNKEKCSVKFNFVVLQDKKYQISVKPVNKETDCPKGVNWVLVGVIVFSVILIVGILIIILFFLIMYCYDKRQYEKFEEEKRKADFNAGANPLYAAPSENAANPLAS